MARVRVDDGEAENPRRRACRHARSAALAISLAAALFAGLPAAAETGLANLRDAPGLWEKAVAAADVEAIVALHAPDTRLLLPNGQVLAGREGVRAAHKANQAVGKNVIHFTDVQLDGDDKHAVMFWSWTLDLAPPNRAPVVVKGRSMLHWKHMPDGWQIVLDMVQTLPAQP